MTISDPNFWAAIEVLNRANINYWLSQGSLLGVTRDNALIPWDKDIDFTAFAFDDNPSLRDKVSRLFLRAGFSLVKDETYNMQFTRIRGRKVDLNFCSKCMISREEYWVQQWLVPVPRFMPRKVNQFMCKLPRKLDRVCGSSTTDLVENILYKYEFRSYKISVVLLKSFEHILIDGVAVPVPVMREDVLEELYGTGWRSPVQTEHWADFAVKDESKLGKSPHE